MNFWALGVPSTIFIDDYLPLRKIGKDGAAYQTFFAKSPNDGAMWPLLLEKAFAKYHGNYLHIELGNPSKAVMALTGAPIVIHPHADKNNVEDMWTKLRNHYSAGDIINCASQAGKDTETDDAGLPLGHAFTVLGIKKLSNGVRLVNIRNPWGRETFKGAWSDSDTENWTPALLKEAGYKNDKNNGIFHMSIEDYHKRMSHTEVNLNN